MKRTPIVTRKPTTLSDLRKPIFLDNPDEMVPMYGFEGVYEISLSGNIRKVSTGEYIPIYDCRTGKAVCLNHPNSDCGTLSANLADIWTSTFLGDGSLNLYSYMDSINKR